MARYSIDGQILTDMADTIREKNGWNYSYTSEVVKINRSNSFYVYNTFLPNTNYKVTFIPTEGASQSGTFSVVINTGGTASTVTVAVDTEVSTIVTYPWAGSSSLSISTKSYTAVFNGIIKIEMADENGNAFTFTPEEIVERFRAPDPFYVDMITRASGGANITSLPDGVTTIGSYAFGGMSVLKNLTLPDNLTSIGAYAFAKSGFIVPETLPSSLTTIGQNAFDGCKTSGRLIIPASITSPPIYLFGTSGPSTASGSELKEVIFLGTPTSLGSSYAGTFYGCYNLTSIKVPWAEGAVANAPWGANNATITYNYVHEEA